MIYSVHNYENLEKSKQFKMEWFEIQFQGS